MERWERIAHKVNTATTPAKHLTKGELAQIMSMSRPALSRRLKGEVGWQYDELELLAKMLGITVDELTSNSNGDTP